MQDPQSYYIRQQGGNVQGPFDVRRVHQFIREGKATRDMQYSRDGRVWARGVDLPQLFAAASTPVPRRTATRRASPDRTEDPARRRKILLVAAIATGAVLIALGAWWFLRPDDPQTQYEEALAYLEGRGVAQDDDEAFRLLRLAAGRGYAPAQLGLGQMYADGRGTPQDLGTAVLWARKAAEQGYAPAQVALGDAYTEGLGVGENETKALEWYHAAAKQGDADGQFGTGRAFRHGLGVDKDLAVAASWLRKAVAQDHARAQYMLAFLTTFGFGVERDPAEATRLYRLAAEQGHAGAQHELGTKYLLGSGVDQDVTEALTWYRRAEEQEWEQTPWAIAGLYRDGLGVPKDLAKAREWLVKGAERGHVAAQSELAAMCADGIGGPRDIDAALRWRRVAAESGNASAQTELGLMYLEGKGVEPDYAKAYTWLSRAAEQGWSSAEKALGDMYFRGRGVSRDVAEGLAWYRKAAERGHPDAQVALGRIYADGDGVEADALKAVGWFQPAADKGHSEAQRLLGYMYATGQGVPQDFATAMGWFRSSAMQGNASAMNNVGFAYYHGRGVTRDYAEALAWFKKAAVAGDALGGLNAGKMFENATGVAQDFSEAARWYRTSAELGNSNAQVSLGYLYDKGKGVTENVSEALEWYREAAEQGNAMGQHNLGLMYDVGRGVTENDVTAVTWYRRSADQGLDAAQYALGTMYAGGEGVTQDENEALRWYRLAAEQGHTRAREAIAEIERKRRPTPPSLDLRTGLAVFADAMDPWSGGVRYAPLPGFLAAEMFLPSTELDGAPAADLERAREAVQSGLAITARGPVATAVLVETGSPEDAKWLAEFVTKHVKMTKSLLQAGGGFASYDHGHRIRGTGEQETGVWVFLTEPSEELRRRGIVYQKSVSLYAWRGNAVLRVYAWDWPHGRTKDELMQLAVRAMARVFGDDVPAEPPAQPSNAGAVTKDACQRVISKAYDAIEKGRTLKGIFDPDAMAEAALEMDPLDDIPAVLRERIPDGMRRLVERGTSNYVHFTPARSIEVTHLVPLGASNRFRATARVRDVEGDVATMHWWLVAREHELFVYDYAYLDIPVRISMLIPISLRAVATGNTDLITALQGMMAAQAFLLAGEVERAKAAIATVDEEDVPKSLQGLVLAVKATFAELTDDKAQALELVERAIEVDPDLHAAYRLRASLRVDAGRYKRALEDIERYEAAVGAEPLALFIKADALRGLDRESEARAAAREATRLMSGK